MQTRKAICGSCAHNARVIRGSCAHSARVIRGNCAYSTRVIRVNCAHSAPPEVGIRQSQHLEVSLPQAVALELADGLGTRHAGLLLEEGAFTKVLPAVQIVDLTCSTLQTARCSGLQAGRRI